MLLTVILHASYNGPNSKTYRYCSKYRYQPPPINAFLDLGERDEQNPTHKD